MMSRKLIFCLVNTLWHCFVFMNCDWIDKAIQNSFSQEIKYLNEIFLTGCKELSSTCHLVNRYSFDIYLISEIGICRVIRQNSSVSLRGLCCAVQCKKPCKNQLVSDLYCNRWQNIYSSIYRNDWQCRMIPPSPAPRPSQAAVLRWNIDLI